MNALPPTTKSRLKKIPQTAAIWEGDRRSLGSMASLLDSEIGDNEECIMWVDGSEGAVRAMEMVSAEMGHEAVVRTFLRAIESPHHPAEPARPQKIVIRDRQLQFFLRGALQGLDIKIEYAADLPLIDELFRGFEAMGRNRRPNLPDRYASLLEKTAIKIWHDAVWDILADSDILTIEIANQDLGTIYVCVMGMMSAEYGILLYRSLESLKQFRLAAISQRDSQVLEQAFLAQDCWFLNYEIAEEDEADWQNNEPEDIIPLFGSLHPFEGMRASLDEEESKIVYLALEAIHRFSKAHRHQLAQEDIESFQENYRLSLPAKFSERQKYSLTVSTFPELTTELLAMEERDVEYEDETISVAIHEDLIPDGSLVTMGQISWELVEHLKQQRKTYYQSLDISPNGKGLPAILVQTSRPKAQAIIETIKEAGGLRAICFNPGNDPFSDESYDLGMLQTGNRDLYLFAEYPHYMTNKTKAVAKWHQTCDQTAGYCSLIITMGVTGANRGNPQSKDMLAVFEAKAIAGDELGLGVLELMPEFE